MQTARQSRRQPAVAETVPPDRASFREVEEALKRYDETLLRQVAAKLFKPRGQWPAEELIERALAALSNPTVVARRLKALEPAERQILALIGHSRQANWHLGNLVELAMALGSKDGLSPILALLECGLLCPVLPDSVTRLRKFEQWLGQAGSTGLRVFAHPIVTDRTLGERFDLPDLSESVKEWKTNSVADKKHPRAPTLSISHAPTHEADGLEWPLRLALLWQQVTGNPLRRTQQGDFFKRDLERLGDESLLHAAPADNLAELPDRGLLAVALAEAVGVLENRDGELHAGVLPSGWDEGLLPALAALWAALPNVETWNPLKGWCSPATTGHGNPYPSAYLLAMMLLAHLPAGAWANPAALEEWLIERHPHWSHESVRPSQKRSWLTAFLLGLAYQLKLVQARKAPAGDWLVRLSDTGRWLLGLGEAPETPHYPQTLLVQPNLEIIAYRQGLTPSTIASLSRFADWKSLGAACMLQLGPESVYRALQSGLSFEDIQRLLQEQSMRGVPAGVVDSLRTWANKRERIAVYPAVTLLEFASTDDLSEALSRGLSAVRVSDRLAMVVSEGAIDYRHFRLAGSRDYGLPPEKCVEVEPDGITLSIDLSRSDLLVDTELRRFAEPLETSAKEGRRQYRLTQASLIAGRDSGFGIRSLEEWFVQRTGQPISPAARLLLTAAQMPASALRSQLVLHVPAPEIADGLLQYPPTAPLIEARLGPTTLAVTEENAPALRERLRSLGLSLDSQ
jgi:hypothetical protein